MNSKRRVALTSLENQHSSCSELVVLLLLASLSGCYSSLSQDAIDLKINASKRDSITVLSVIFAEMRQEESCRIEVVACNPILVADQVSSQVIELSQTATRIVKVLLPTSVESDTARIVVIHNLSRNIHVSGADELYLQIEPGVSLLNIDLADNGETITAIRLEEHEPLRHQVNQGTAQGDCAMLGGLIKLGDVSRGDDWSIGDRCCGARYRREVCHVGRQVAVSFC